MPREKFIPALLPKRVPKAELSPTQLAAINLPHPALASVIGSPGAGKSTALVARFKELRKFGISADEILVITQTRESANLLRDQLALENQGASSGPLAKTISSIAFSILAEKAKREGEKSPELLSGSQADSLLADLVAEEDVANWPKNIDAVTLSLSGFRTEVRDLLQVAIEYSISPSQLAE
ncbi:MAG: UvrD-helicase domain-containing protein, partial [Actinomycetota bacterium]